MKDRANISPYLESSSSGALYAFFKTFYFVIFRSLIEGYKFQESAGLRLKFFRHLYHFSIFYQKFKFLCEVTNLERALQYTVNQFYETTGQNYSDIANMVNCDGLITHPVCVLFRIKQKNAQYYFYGSFLIPPLTPMTK